MGQCKMRYVGYINRLCLMLEKEKLTREQMIDKIYEIMNKDESIIGGITKIEICQAMESRGF